MKPSSGVLVTVLVGALALGAGACSKSSDGATKGGAAGSAGKSSAMSGSGGEAGQASQGGSGGVDPVMFEAGAGGELPTGAAGAPGEGGAGGEGDFVNPVQGSEADAEPLGDDADHNGVRDDLDAFMRTLSNEPSEQQLLTSLAREETGMLLLGADQATTPSAVREQAIRSMAVHRCVVDALGPERARIAVTELESALLNNELRWKSWLAADHLLQGSILPNTPCDGSLVKP